MDLFKLCESIPVCVGYSNTKRRIYTTSYVYVPGVEVFVVSRKFRTTGLMGGTPIGGTCGQNYYMGTVSFFAKDPNGNYYLITDSHVVPCYDTVYFPSPIVYYYPNYTAEKEFAGLAPQPIGEVIYRSNISQKFVNLDMAIIKLYPGVIPHPITYGKQMPLYFMTANELENVIKVGARTGVTNGIIVDKSATMKIMNVYGDLIYFTGPLFQLYSQEGDSGGPIFVGNAIVGTIVAGNGEFVIANDVTQIIRTLSAYNLKLYVGPNKFVMYLSAIPPLVVGAVLTAMSFFLD